MRGGGCPHKRVIANVQLQQFVSTSIIAGVRAFANQMSLFSP
jgi:hypothetical protein